MIFWIVFIIISIIAIVSYFTNPFVRFSLIKDISKVELKDGSLVLEKIHSIKLQYRFFWRHFSMLKSAWHIVGSRFGRRNRTRATEINEIAKEIHEKRFNPKNMYLISGDHFSVFYPRSLGIFFHTILDPRTALSDEDWLNRQKIYLKSLAYALNVFSQSDQLSTTIVPTTPTSVILMNIYSLPSDTLYSMLYAFDQLLGSNSLQTIYPFNKQSEYKLSTQDAAQSLLDEYRETLKRHYTTYRSYAFDEETQCIKKDVHLSGTKDIVKKQSGFYDNVIFWKTTEMSMKLGIIDTDKKWLQKLKEHIIATFWRENGVFIEDLSDESIKEKWYSSDWLIAYQTGFLDVQNNDDRKYLVHAVEYILEKKIDLPFPIRYHNDFRPNRLYFPVNIAARGYGSTVIWSHWGTEFIKLLLALGKKEQNKNYLSISRRHIETYEYNIVRYRGYPEVYDSNGDFYTSLFYRSVRTTGWIISFEQTQLMSKYL